MDASWVRPGSRRLRAGAAEAALEQAPVAVATLTPELRVVNANAKFHDLANGAGTTMNGGEFRFPDRTAQVRLVELTQTAPPVTAAFNAREPDGQQLKVLAARCPTQIVQTHGGTAEGAAIVSGGQGVELSL